MDKVLFGDNQFFAVNHASDEKSRAQAIRFKDDSAIYNDCPQGLVYFNGIQPTNSQLNNKI